jgi:hypothetical protein
MSKNTWFFAILAIATLAACWFFSKKSGSKNGDADMPGRAVFDVSSGTVKPAYAVPPYTAVPLPPGYETLTLNMTRGGNAGYMADPYWAGGWLGLPGLPE